MCISRFLPPANKVWGKVIFFAPVCHSVHGGGGVPGQVPPAGTPPWAGTPQAGTPPWAGTPPMGRYTPWAGTPPSVHAWIRSTSGRYASYWNAFLFLLILDERWPTNFSGIYLMVVC